jgi:predicted RND superfamily exporter protein
MRSTVRPLHLHSFGSDILCRASLRRPRLTLLLTVGATLALAVAAGRLEFDDDIRNMRSPGNRADLLRREVMETFGRRFSPMTVRLDGASEGEVLAAARRLVPELEALVAEGQLAGIDTIAGVIPSEEQQQQVIDRLVEAAPGLADLGARLDRALRAEGLRPEGFAEGIAHLQQALAVRRPLRLDDLRGTTLERAVARYVVAYDHGVSTAIYCYAPAGQWLRSAPPALVEVLTHVPNAVLAGPNVVSAELRRIVWGDAARAAVLGLVLVFLLMWADLGGPVRALLALVPLVVGMSWMLGAMALLGIRVNFMNIFVLTMIIGIGVDYGVHLLHRWDESGGDPLAVSETAKAIGVAALTTMVGFGSLVLSHYPGLRSVGAAAILGALSTAVLSMTLMPVLLQGVARARSGPGAADRREDAVPRVE